VVCFGPGLTCIGLLLGSLVNCCMAQVAPHAMTAVAYAHRDARTGVASLRARAAELAGRGRPLQLTLRALLRFDPERAAWTPRSLPARQQAYSRDTDPVILLIPDSVGLFWAAWDEDGAPAAAFLFAGPILCNDVMLSAPPPGQIAMCVPLPDGAVARYVS
jgi:hypothetical protein